MQIGGDSQNTTPVAIQSGLQAQKLAKPMLQAAKEGTKLPFDKFISTVKDQTLKNAPVADAMQQQSFFVKLAQKIPGIGPRITAWLGPDAIVNNAISGLSKGALGKINPAEVTRIALEGGDDVAKKLLALGVPSEAVETVAKAAAERAAAMGGKAVVQQAAATVAKGMSDDAIQGILQATKNGGMLAGKKVTTDAIQQAIKNGGDDVVGALRQLGLRADAAKQLAEGAAKSVTSQAVEQGAKTVTTEVAKKAGGIKGLFGKLFSGAKGNFIISGIFSLGSNAIQLATGQMNIKQFIALTGMDTLAYGAIGLGASAAGGAIAGAIGQALIPIPGLGFLVGLGIGMAGGLLYEKFLRNPVKNMLGGGAAAYNPGVTPGVAPGEYSDPYAQYTQSQQQLVDPYAQQPQAQQQTPYVDPYAQQQPQAQQPAAVPTGDMTYEQAMQYLNSMQ